MAIVTDVAVPELPDDPSLYARALNAAGYFEALAFLPEDKQRAAYYQDNARRIALQSQAGDLDAYLGQAACESPFIRARRKIDDTLKQFQGQQQ